MALELTAVWDRVRKDSRSPLIVLLIMSLLILSTLYSTFNFLNVGRVEASPPPDTRGISTAHLSNISTLHLYGDASAIPVNLPKTQLQLTLQGIALAATKNGESRALIAGPDQKVRVYKKGDAVPGGAVIRKITREQVILDFNGELQTLNLPVPKLPEKMITKVTP